MSYFNEIRSLLNRTRGWTPEEQVMFEGLLTDAVKHQGQRSQLEELFIPRPLLQPLPMPWIRPRLAGFGGAPTGAHWSGVVPISGLHHFEAHLYGGDWLPHVKNPYVREAAWIAASNVTLRRTLPSYYDIRRIISPTAATILSRPAFPARDPHSHEEGRSEDHVRFWLAREGEDPMEVGLCLRHNGALGYPGISSNEPASQTHKLRDALNLTTYSEFRQGRRIHFELTPEPVPLEEMPGVWRTALDKLFNLLDPDAGYVLLRDPALYSP